MNTKKINMTRLFIKISLIVTLIIQTITIVCTQKVRLNDFEHIKFFT
jgi:hypothetical protein